MNAKGPHWVRRILLGAVLPVLACALPAMAAAPEAAPTTQPSAKAGTTALEEDGDVYPVTSFQVAYMFKRQGVPSTDQLMDTKIELGRLPSGLVKPRPGVPTVQFKLADFPQLGIDKIYLSGLRAISEQLVAALNRDGLIGVYAGVDNAQISASSLEDVREKGDTSIKLQIFVGAVTELRTVAAGDRFKPGDRINNPAHERIKENSPVQPKPGENLLRKKLLDQYVDQLNRFPWRRVDISLSAAEQEGGVTLDYIIAESKPWSTYFQLSNTGTEQTTKWRERVGLVHNDLTGHTDILSLDYVTGNFDEANAVLASYETPLFTPKLRGRIYGAWSQYTASDVGIQALGQEFDGEEWGAGAELLLQLYGQSDLYVDALGGVRYKHTETDNKTSDIKGTGEFWVPYLGFRLHRFGETSATTANMQLQFGRTSDVTTESGGNTRDVADGLGRLNVDDNWQAITGDVSHSFYLEPLLNPKGFKTLANEILLQGKMQWVLGHNRLVPQEQMVAGGVYSVRGYPESAIAGDTVLLGSAEYRFHVPRALGIQKNPSMVFKQPFYWAPPRQFARPDWDLVLKAFVDAGRVIQNDRLEFENNNTMLSAGVGFELSFKQNVSLRVDYGVVLQDITLDSQGGSVNEGDGRLHVIFTLMY